MISYRRLVEALDDFVQEAGHDEALGNRNGNAACAHIKQFVCVDLAGGGTVRATDVVGEDFEPGIELASESSLKRRLRTF
jgi:hypothetical protein